MSHDVSQHILLTSGKDEPYNAEAMHQMALAAYGVSHEAVINSVFWKLVKELTIQNVCVLVVMFLIDIIGGFPIKPANYILFPLGSLIFSPTMYALMRDAASKAWKAGTTYRMSIDFAITNARIRQLPEPQFTPEQLKAIQLEVATFIATSEMRATRAEVTEAIKTGLSMSANKADPRCDNCGQRLGEANQPCPICKESNSATSEDVPVSAGLGPEPNGDGSTDLGDSATKGTDPQAS